MFLQIPYKRSKEHINDLIDSLCEGQMSDYAQARWKDTKEPTIIRIMSHDGGMNPDFSLVDVIPDEDLNKRLQFYLNNFSQDQLPAFLKTAERLKVKGLAEAPQSVKDE